MTKNNKELWQQCIEWIKSTGIEFPVPDQNFNKLADFAAILRNGILLCELAIRLSPDCIDPHEILTQYQHSPFICSKNIALFLNACREHFQIKELFNEEDLFELQNFAAVLRLLSQLSRSQKSRQLGLRPFPEETVLPTEMVADESIYCNLREEVDQEYKQISQYTVLSKRNQENSDREIYDSICSQGVSRDKSSLPISYSEFKPSNKREYSLKELLDTEVNYCDALQMIVDIFYNRMRFHLQSDDLATIFINILDILRVNRSFLSKLKPAILHELGLENNSEAATPSKISDVFLSYKFHFTIYGTYCSRLDASTNRIEELERTDPFMKRVILETANNVEYKLQNKTATLKLQQLLIIPFQRITRYHLLLETIIKNTTDAMEQARLKNAHEAMKELVTYVNEWKRDHEMMLFINTIQESITDLDVNLLNYGRFLCDDSLKITITRNSDTEKYKQAKQRYVFLFEKMILCAKRETGMYKAKDIFELCDFELLDNANDLDTNTLMPSYKNNTISRKLTNTFFDNNTFTLVKRDHKNSGNILTSLQLAFKSFNDMNTWRKFVREAINANTPKAAIAKGHTLLYKTYTKPTICAVCQMLLYGKFFQGYHCSGCNKDMHLECAQSKECIIRRSADTEMINNGILKSNSNGNGIEATNESSPSKKQNFYPGEIVVSRQTIPPNSESRRLSCQSGDFIELLEVNTDDGTALGRLSTRPTSVGWINLNSLVKNVNTLEKLRRRSSRSSSSIATSPLSEMITLQCSISPNPNSSPSLHTSSPPTHRVVKPVFVSSHIITLSEQDATNSRKISDQPWFFGDIGREHAKNLLDGTECGTFIVRWSPQWQLFVISFRTGDSVKHIKVQFDAERKKFYLHGDRLFDNVVELITWYRYNNLNEGFALDAILKGTPLKGKIFRAMGAFSRTSATCHYLTLNLGDIVQVLDTAGDARGWWKGSINGDRIGFFPVSYVALEDPYNVRERTIWNGTDNGVTNGSRIRNGDLTLTNNEATREAIPTNKEQPTN